MAKYEVDDDDKDNNNHVASDDMSLELKELGIENQAYKIDEDEPELESKFEGSRVIDSEQVNSAKSVPNDQLVMGAKSAHATNLLSSPVISSPSLSISSAASSDGDDSDVSTTIIDGKRAISLSNFGKFAAQQQKREGHRPMGPTFGHPMASAGFRAKTALPK